MRRKISFICAAGLLLAMPSLVFGTTHQQEICARRTCSAALPTCPSATACQTLYADRVRSVCGLTAPNTLCLTNEDTTCLRDDVCLARDTSAGPTATTPSSSTGLCCKCRKAGRGVCVQNISDAGNAANCGSILQQSTTLRGLVSSNIAFFSDVTCENAPLNASQCRAVAQGGTCGGESFANPPVVEPAGIVTAFSTPTAGVNATTAADTSRPFRPITPELGVRFPGTELSAPTMDEGMVTIPFLAQYIAAGYKYGVSIAMIAAIIMAIYGGFRYLVGSAFEDVSRGKQILTDAIAGLMIALGAYLLLANVNPATLRLEYLSLRGVSTESLGDPEDSDSRLNEDGSVGPHSLCRENLLHPNPHAWVAACGSQGLQPSSNPSAQHACTALTTQCGGAFGAFIAAVSDNCRSKRFDGLYGLDGVTFGILDFTEDNLPALLNDYQRESPEGYQHAFGNSGVNVSRQWFCDTNRSSRGLMCHTGFSNAMQQALRDPAFIRVQAKTAYRYYTGRIALARHFSSPYGRVMYAVVMNNPGRCGSGFGGVFSACQTEFAGTDENAKIECFLREYESQGCRNGVASAHSRATAIRAQLTSVSRAPAPLTSISEAEVLNCVQRGLSSS